ncbi:MAG: dipeptidase [Oceanotoga sp.]|jgi:dipeptidase D|uniref:Cytosol non-specific dipeptidase n=1 Tax=Oceanotoga teriensis TaxID=515440 RepID=A0AA45C8S0_9BACT|nr:MULTISPECIES: aminoacyl-histidine dipeptidase [Oceanotoga]MDN5343740.1 dipeptidase [Oceanotoga sp.]PWJ96431.1 dipeptidase D [Oceanotoga teriensis]
MNKVLENLEPKEVFKWFEEINQIPRCSKCEKKISDWLFNFAKERNLEVIQDKALNIIIRKNGTNGKENNPIITLQGHMDMVCEKESSVKHDFSKDPIKMKINGDFIETEGTTLGGDDGIAVAFALALLDSKDIAHPPIEVLITTDEETGMTGAHNLNPENIKGKTLINIDSEEEGIFLVSCAGGMRENISLDLEYKESKKDYRFFEIYITGLNGGHSGSEIIKQKANANKLMGRVLYEISKNTKIRLVDLIGGAKDNAIPRESKAIIAFDEKYFTTIKNDFDEIVDIIKKEYYKVDKNIRIDFKESKEKFKKVIKNSITKKIINIINLIPDGVIRMSDEIEDLVETSNNLGIIEIKDKKIYFKSASRSSIESKKDYMHMIFDNIAFLTNSTVQRTAEYPAWQFKENSKIRNVFIDVYKKMYNKDPEISAIHAGLECGLFKEKLGDIDMISFGPNLYDVHTPKEKMSISSVERSWNFLKNILKEL